MKFILILAVTFSTAAADARIVFGSDFIPRNTVEMVEEEGLETTTEVIGASWTPVCPGSEDWCDSPLHYPEQAILTAAIKQNKTLATLFGSRKKESQQSHSLRTSFGPSENSDFTVFEPVEDELINICSVKTEYIMPRAAKNKDGEYKYIVNQPGGEEEYVQEVRVTLCQAAEQSCGHGHLAGSGLETKCRQEYSDHKLVSLSATGEELQVETFQFPSCCTCYISHFTEY